MNYEQFNEKYKAYLVNSYYGLAIQRELVIEYLDKKFQELIKIPDFQYKQIKLKFGEARFYANGISQGIRYEIENGIDSIMKEFYKNDSF